jgi:TonB-dependent SusC/RagA subfamily outer membrane receptor
MKLKTALLSLCVLLTGLLQMASGQNLPVSGTVSNKSTGEPLVGATISVKGTRTNTMTGANGQFTIAIPKAGSVLVFSYTGMKQVEFTVSDNKSAVNIQLEESTTSTLTDVVVVGYGTQKVTKVSGAISTIKSADIEKLKPVRVEEALQGRASGVVVVNSGTPGAKPTVLVRGIPSFSGTDPLVIIDGVPQSLTDFNSINAADIESINLLKDAATTAIYGVKGGNGVIVVTTKNGRKNQKTDITFQQ